MSLKSIIVVAFSILYYSSLYSQSIFQNSYGMGNGKLLKRSRDDNLIITGINRQSHYCSKVNYSYDYSFCLLKIDTLGKVLWNSSYIDGDNQGLQSVNPIFLFEPDNDEFDVFIDSWYCPPISMYYLFKVNSIGEINQGIELPFALSGAVIHQYYETIDFISLEDDYYFVLSENKIVTLNQEGDTLGSKTLNIEDYFKIKNWQLLPNDYKLYLGQDKDGNSKLIKYSEPNDSVIWIENTIGSYATNYNIKDSVILICGIAEVNSNPTLTSLNLDGETLKHKVFSDSYDIRFLRAVKINDSMIVAIQYDDSYNLIFLDENFDIYLKTELENLKSFSFLNVISNNIYILGSTKNTWLTEYDQEILLIKTNLTGEIPPLKSMLINNKKSNFNIEFYPNPSKGEITISGQYSIEDINIFNSFGQLVYTEKKIDQELLKINFTKKPGLYLIQIRFKNKNSYISKVLITD